MVYPIKQVKRHIKGQNEKVHMNQPPMIANYVVGMGEVDMLDRLISAYRPQIKGQK